MCRPILFVLLTSTNTRTRPSLVSTVSCVLLAGLVDVSQVSLGCLRCLDTGAAPSLFLLQVVQYLLAMSLHATDNSVVLSLNSLDQSMLADALFVQPQQQGIDLHDNLIEESNRGS